MFRIMNFPNINDNSIGIFGVVWHRAVRRTLHLPNILCLVLH
jgi:hypothetical protein